MKVTSRPATTTTSPRAASSPTTETSAGPKKWASSMASMSGAASPMAASIWAADATFLAGEHRSGDDLDSPSDDARARQRRLDLLHRHDGPGELHAGCVNRAVAVRHPDQVLLVVVLGEVEL